MNIPLSTALSPSPTDHPTRSFHVFAQFHTHTHSLHGRLGLGVCVRVYESKCTKKTATQIAGATKNRKEREFFTFSIC